MRAPGSVRVEGLTDLRRALKSMEKGAPRELNKALRKSMIPVELVASARTPRASGALQRSNRVATSGAGVKLVNAQPYAMAIHWGRKQIKGVPEGRPWIWDTVQEQRDEIGRRVIREIEVFVSRELP